MANFIPKGVLNRAIVRIYTSLFFKGSPAVPVFTFAGAPSNGTSGTLVGIAAPGALLINTTSKTLYQNTNTLASPTWTLFSLTTGAGDFTGTFQGTVGNVTPAALVGTTIAGTDATDASSSTTGALKTSGGLGVAKAAFIGTDLTIGGFTSDSVAATVTATPGGTQAAAFALTKTINIISVCALANDSVRLPATPLGKVVYVFNTGAAAARVFGAGTNTVDSVATATGVPLGIGARAIFVGATTSNWVSALLGAVSA